MPSFTNLVIALPCDTFEDFPAEHRGPNAENLLACWTGLWHPALIKQVNSVAEIQSTGETAGFWQTLDAPAPLIVVPNVSATKLDSATLMGWTSNCDALVIEELADRTQIIEYAASNSEELNHWKDSVSQKIVNDFYALGYAYLQTMLMSLQLRYSTNLDHVDFDAKVIAAAEAAIAGDEKQTTDKLFACFDTLLEEKNSYYPVEPQICELLLTHPNTLGGSLTKQLESSDAPISVLISGQDAKKLADKNQPALESIKQRIKAKKLSIIGGLDIELDDNLVCGETVANQLATGRDSITQAFGQPPNVFARRSFGLNPTTPDLLNSFGFAGAIHANFSSGTIPSMGSGAMRWTSDSDQHILAISELPMDASDSGTFLNLGIELGEMIDSAHSATALLTHWPNKACQSLDDLKRIATFVPLFGDFVTAEFVFDEAYDPGYGQTFTADEYESPHLKNAIQTNQTNPISRYTDYWRRFHQLETARRIALLATIEHDLDQTTLRPFQQRAAQLQSEIEIATVADDPLPSPASIDQSIQTLVNEATRLIQAKPIDPQDSKTSTAFRFFNCHSAKQRIEVKPPAELSLPTGSRKAQPPVCFAINQSASGTNSKASNWILELPGFSKSTIDFGKVETTNLFLKAPPLSTDLLLQNEFFKIQIDEKSGGVRSIQQHTRKTNLAGQQLAIRLPKDHASKTQYADMVADSIETIENQTLAAAIRSTGRLMAGGQELARFEQTVRIVRGINRIEFNVKLEPIEALTASRDHYICSRLAWKSEGARLMANVLDSSEQVATPWFYATQFVTIKETDTPSVSMLTGGLPFHRRANRRMFDSLLMTSNESQTHFSFALAIDQPYPCAAAAARLSPTVQLQVNNATALNQSPPDWLFHFNRKNILATSATPIFSDTGKCNGVSLRLKETESRKAELTISAFRALKSAEIVKFNGEVFSTLPLDEADNRRVTFLINPLSFLQVNLYFQT